MVVAAMADFRQKMKQYFEDVYNNSEEILIQRPGGKNIVIMAQEEYDSLQETLYLMSSEANRQHIIKGMKQKGGTKMDTKDLWK